jgi:hypothetical protein
MSSLLNAIIAVHGRQIHCRANSRKCGDDIFGRTGRQQGGFAFLDFFRRVISATVNEQPSKFNGASLCIGPAPDVGRRVRPVRNTNLHPRSGSRFVVMIDLDLA